MKTAIFSFSKPTPESTVASNRIATFISDIAQTPVIFDDSIADVDCDVLIIVNGAFGFCKYLPDLAAAVIKAPHIVWVQNDYTIIPPKEYSDAESPFRKAFVTRRLMGKPNINWWTTVMPNAKRTPHSAYINWNSLTYELQPKFEPDFQDLFYYGAFREKRTKAFDRYFTEPVVTVSSTSKKFEQCYPSINVVDGIDRSRFYRELGRHGFGLYLEDEKSHKEFHSPANRFYEMLSAGLPMLFQPECEYMMKAAGIDIRPYILRRTEDLAQFWDHREDIQRTQGAAWQGNYVRQLTAAVRKELKHWGEVIRARF